MTSPKQEYQGVKDHTGGSPPRVKSTKWVKSQLV